MERAGLIIFLLFTFYRGIMKAHGQKIIGFFGILKQNSNFYQLISTKSFKIYASYNNNNGARSVGNAFLTPLVAPLYNYVYSPKHKIKKYTIIM